jgi:regulator-associated protein of mTOR
MGTQSNSPLTTLTADFAVSPIVVAGFADGAIKAFDRRIRDTDAVVRTFREHVSWVVGAQCQRYDEKVLVTAR